MRATNILFICGGAFAGLDKIIGKRIGKSAVGFGAQVRSKSSIEASELLAKVMPEDLLNFGLIPEFIGRLPVISAVHQLQREDLVQILMEPKNALVKQYQKLFAMDGVDLEIRPSALQAIARKALARKWKRMDVTAENLAAKYGLQLSGRVFYKDVNFAVYEMPDIKDVANLQTLFRSAGGFCDCEHCGSVYSPAAYFVDLLRYLDGGRRRDAVLFGVFFAWNAMTNVHYAMFSGLLVLLVLAHGALARDRRTFRPRWKGAALAVALAGIAVLPFYVPYAKVSKIYGMVRSEGEIEHFSGRPIDFLTAGPQNKLYAPLTQKWAHAEGMTVIPYTFRATMPGKFPDVTAWQIGTPDLVVYNAGNAAMGQVHDMDAGRAQGARRGNHVRQHRPPRDRVQHLVQIGFHPRALAGRGIDFDDPANPLDVGADDVHSYTPAGNGGHFAGGRKAGFEHQGELLAARQLLRRLAVDDAANHLERKTLANERRRQQR